jgi:hypothetical protein
LDPRDIQQDRHRPVVYDDQRRLHVESVGRAVGYGKGNATGLALGCTSF